MKQDADDDVLESGEAEKLTETKEADEPKTKDQGTSMSQERLSLMIKYNQIGSLTSLPRGSRVSFAVLPYFILGLGFGRKVCRK